MRGSQCDDCDGVPILKLWDSLLVPQVARHRRAGATRAFAHNLTGLIHLDPRNVGKKAGDGPVRESTELRMMRSVLEFLGSDVKAGIGCRHAGIDRSLEEKFFHIALL